MDSELTSLCQSVLEDFNLCLFYLPSSPNLSLASEEEEEYESGYAFLPDLLIFQMVVICLMGVHSLKRAGTCPRLCSTGCWEPHCCGPAWLWAGPGPCPERSCWGTNKGGGPLLYPLLSLPQTHGQATGQTQGSTLQTLLAGLCGASWSGEGGEAGLDMEVPGFGKGPKPRVKARADETDREGTPVRKCHCELARLEVRVTAELGWGALVLKGRPLRPGPDACSPGFRVQAVQCGHCFHAGPLLPPGQPC